ncbi:MAG: histidine kinase [Bacteroidetes bacterium]|nr:histidine kinase [Bacteroidota bacterium]
MRFQLTNKYVHILFIAVYCLTPIASSPDFDGTGRIFELEPFRRDFLRHVLLIAFFYLNYSILLNQLATGKKLILYFLVLLLVFILIVKIPYWLIPNNQANSFHIRDDGSFRPFITSLFPFLLALSSSMVLFSFGRTKDMDRKRVETELQNLKFHLQPHFLFNTLNSIYALSLTKAQATPASILKLSSLLHYVIDDSAQNRVKLSRELEHVQDYITLQLLRTDEHLEFTLNIEGDPGDLEIAPLILINFVENAFKYGYNVEKKSFIDITIQLNGDTLNFNVRNAKAVSASAIPSTGLGQKYTVQRLNLIYPDQHQLVVQNSDTEYAINLTLKLHDHSHSNR